MRIAWRIVGATTTRVWAEVEALHDRFAGLSRIGIDEISYERGPAVSPWWSTTTPGGWCGPHRPRQGHPGAVLRWARSAALRSPTSRPTERTGSAPWSPGGASTRSGADSFHAGAGRASGQAGGSPACRYALWEIPENLTGRQQAKPAWVAKTDPRLHLAIPARGRSAAGVPAPAHRGRRGTRGLDRIGPSVPGPGVHRPTPPDRQTPRLDPGRDRTRPVPRTHRIGGHRDLTDQPRIAFGSRSPEAPSSPWPCSTSAATTPSSHAGRDPRRCQESLESREDGPQLLQSDVARYLEAAWGVVRAEPPGEQADGSLKGAAESGGGVVNR